MRPDKNHIISELKSLQDYICSGLEALDGQGKFKEDAWERPGGVNFSHVNGEMPEKITKALGIEPCHFDATGVSIVLHPVNPHVPIIHMNVRYFETDQGLYWFGGGIDLTPHFVTPDLAKDFHTSLKDICDRTDTTYYPEFKKWADDYFYVRHRKETRGIGGIFFDRLNDSRSDKETLFDFLMNVGRGFLPIYTQQFESNYNRSYTERDKEWQLNRRGRYVEFNLVWDRGTKFGLDTDGNIESILMSLPPETRWTYKYPLNEEEKTTQDYLVKGIDWVNYK